MKKTLKILAALLVLLNALNANGQSYSNVEQNKINGIITNKKIAVDNAIVYLLKAKDSTIVKSNVTNNSGEFELNNFNNDTFILLVQKVGFGKYYSNKLSFTNNAINVGEIEITIQRKEDEIVKIVSKKPMIEVKADKTILNVEANINNVGSNALEVLQTAPGVLVDKDGKVSLKGNSSVLIYIDGRPSYLSGTDLTNMLSNMQSNQLETIEIMTNPPAKYDATGNGGIINIKTKKAKLFGFNGSVNLNAGVGLGYPRFGESININYRKNKINLYSSLSHSYRENYQRLLINRNFMNDNSALVTSKFSQINEPKRKGLDYSGKVGVDYFINKKTTIGAVLKTSITPNNVIANGTILLSNGSGILESTTQSQSVNKTEWKNLSLNTNMRHIFDSASKELTIDIDYISYSAKNEMTLSNAYFKLGVPSSVGDTLYGDLPQNINIYSAKVDYQMPINKTLQFEAGLKSSFVNTQANALYDSLINGVIIPSVSRTNFFNYKEYVNAAYVNFNKKINDKFSMQTGLRLESTSMKGKELTTNKDFQRNYVQLFPTVYFQYDMNKKNSFVLNYGRRINRPDYENLNPFVEYLDKYTFEEGNPYLKPEFAHNIEFTHTYNQFLTTTFNYNKTTDIIEQIFITNPNKTETAIKKDNVANSNTIGININAGMPIKKWWTTNINLSVAQNKFNGLINNKFVSQKFARAGINIDNQFKFKKGWSASLSGFYVTGEIDGVLIINSLHNIDFGIGKSIMKNKATLRFSFKDVFFSQIASGYTKYNNVDINFKQLRNSRMANLSFTYKFNKGKLKATAQRKNGGAEEEQKRVSTN